MIEAQAIAHWGRTHPWPTAEQVEQDLLLSRAICALADDPYLGEELVFRGGTAFHKLYLPRPYRYSEDLDYVRRTSGGIKPLTMALTAVGHNLGFEVRTRISQHPKVYWRTTADSDVPLRIKIEVNTHELSPALPTVRRGLEVVSPWWSGTAQVQIFQLAELVATKIRALYQRAKGRDLFDLWLALTQTDISPEAVLGAFGPYRPQGLTPNLAIANLRLKLADAQFRHDVDLLVADGPLDYSIDTAADLVIDQLLTAIR